MMKSVLLAVAVLGATTLSLQAQNIERACLRSDRDAKSRVLCGCIQDAANLTLSPVDQRLAASFYKDPSRVQKIRESNQRANMKFWERYMEYVEAAQAFCS